LAMFLANGFSVKGVVQYLCKTGFVICVQNEKM
jgi:sRNA-binding regulator protein Hfq